jgi:hypothetical protein
MSLSSQDLHLLCLISTFRGSAAIAPKSRAVQDRVSDEPQYRNIRAAAKDNRNDRSIRCPSHQTEGGEPHLNAEHTEIIITNLSI